MAAIREAITLGLAQRAAAGIKVRQPLQSVKIAAGLDLKPELLEIIKEELNVKGVIFEKLAEGQPVSAEMNLEITDELKREGLARELIRHIQQARKNAGLNVDDRVELRVESDSKEITAAFNAHKDEIYHETLATGELTAEAGHTEEVKLDGHSAQVQLLKR